MKNKNKKIFNWINISLLFVATIFFCYTIFAFIKPEYSFHIDVWFNLTSLFSQVIIFGILIEMIIYYLISFCNFKFKSTKKEKNNFWKKNVALSLKTQDTLKKRLLQKQLYVILVWLFIMMALSSAEMFSYYGVSWNEDTGYTSPSAIDWICGVGIIEFLVMIIWGVIVFFYFPAITIESRMEYEKTTDFKKKCKEMSNKKLQKISNKELKFAKYMKYIDKKTYKQYKK